MLACSDVGSSVSFLLTQAASYSRQHGGHLTSLEVRGWGQPHDWLPCRNLQRMVLSCGVLSMPADSALGSCTGLTHIALNDVRFANKQQVQLFTEQMTSLQELIVVASRDPLVSCRKAPRTFEVLPPLLSLTRLELRELLITNQFLQHLGALSNLRSLTLQSYRHTCDGPDDVPEEVSEDYHAIHDKSDEKVYSYPDPEQQSECYSPLGFHGDELTALPPVSSLTCLQLELVQPHSSYLQQLNSFSHLCSLSIKTPYMRTTDFAGVTGLQQLQSLRLAFDSEFHSGSMAAFFKSLTALRTLHMSDCVPTFVVCEQHWMDVPDLYVLTQLTALTLEHVALHTPEELLLLLSKLTQLRLLHLDAPSAYWPAATAAYTALTASSQLQQLRVCQSQLPESVWQQVFAGNRQLTKLTDLHVDGDTLSSANGTARVAPAFSAADLEACVNCCPGLRSLWVAQQQGWQNSCLQRLSVLQALALDIHSEAAASELASLTQLTSLTMAVRYCSQAALDCLARRKAVLPGLTSLASLKQLQKLTCWWDAGKNPSHGGGKCGFYLELLSKAPPGSPADVWQKVMAWQ